MKKLTTIIAALALFFSASAFDVNPAENVTEKVITAFQKNFTGAENVTWEKTNDFYFAHFEINKNQLNVAYDEEGQILGMSRKIQLSQLPLSVVQSLKDQYNGYSINDSVSEIVFEGQTSYYLSAEGKTGILSLKSSADGLISIEKKTRKKILVGSAY